MSEQKYVFCDEIGRNKIEEKINEMNKQGYSFVAFLQYDGSYDKYVGILFKKDGCDT